MEAYEGWRGSSGENDSRKYLVTSQNLTTMLLERQELLYGESVVRNKLDLTYSQLQYVRKVGYVDVDNHRHFVTLLY